MTATPASATLILFTISGDSLIAILPNTTRPIVLLIPATNCKHSGLVIVISHLCSKKLNLQKLDRPKKLNLNVIMYVCNLHPCEQQPVPSNTYNHAFYENSSPKLVAIFWQGLIDAYPLLTQEKLPELLEHQSPQLVEQ